MYCFDACVYNCVNAWYVFVVWNNMIIQLQGFFSVSVTSTIEKKQQQPLFLSVDVIVTHLWNAGNQVVVCWQVWVLHCLAYSPFSCHYWSNFWKQRTLQEGVLGFNVCVITEFSFDKSIWLSFLQKLQNIMFLQWNSSGKIEKTCFLQRLNFAVRIVSWIIASNESNFILCL